MLFYFSLLYKIPSYPKSVRIICLSCVTLFFGNTILDLEPISNILDQMLPQLCSFLTCWSQRTDNQNLKKKNHPNFIRFFSLSETPKKSFTLHLSFLHLQFLTPFTLLQKHTHSHNHQNFLHQDEKNLFAKKNPSHQFSFWFLNVLPHTFIICNHDEVLRDYLKRKTEKKIQNLIESHQCNKKSCLEISPALP